MNDKISFGKFLREKRIDRNLTVRKMSSQLCIAHAYLSEIENDNKSPPNDKILQKMAIVLNLNNEDEALFYDLAAYYKGLNNDKNYYLPVDISEYLLKNNTLIKVIRTSHFQELSKDFWEELLGKINN